MENTQVPKQHPEFTVDRKKAAMGNATLLQSFLLPKAQQQPQESTPGQTPQPQEQPKESKASGIEDKVELNMTDKLDQIRKELKDDFQRELDEIKQTITAALAEDDEQDKTTENS